MSDDFIEPPEPTIEEECDFYKRENSQLRSQLAMRDEETARLEAEKTFMAKNITELVDERAELRARLAELQTANDDKAMALTALLETISNQTARQLALEAQCQRMRDALNLAIVYLRAGGIDDVADGADAALSDPLDLELLNRVRFVLNQVLQSAFPRQKEHPAMYSAWRGAEELLKSLSPAP